MSGSAVGRKQDNPVQADELTRAEQPRDSGRLAWYGSGYEGYDQLVDHGGSARDRGRRRGLVQSAWPWVVLGAVTLAAYGLVVNANRSIAFGRLMGAYIAVFFVVSQILSAVFFAERPSLSLLLGGALIVGGALIIQMGTP